jgi:microcystin-dependent protein
MNRREADRSKNANVVLTAERSDILAEMGALRQRFAALEANLAGPVAGHAVARRRSLPATARTLAILASGAVLGGASIVYGQGTVEALFISKEGYVGIGTTTPSSILDVAPSGGGTFYLRDSAGAAGTIELSASGGANYIESGLSTANSSAATLYFTDMNAQHTWMTITGTGSVGIGTAPKTHKLEVNGRIADQTGPVMPVGTIIAFAGQNQPDGWLLCDGGPLPSGTVYAELRKVLGTSPLPDLRGRTLIGSGTPAASSATYNLRDMLGEEKHTLKIEEMPKHHHAGWGEVFPTEWRYGVTDSPKNLGSGASDHDNYLYNTSDTGGGQPFNNMQPSYVVNYIIKY